MPEYNTGNVWGIFCSPNRKVRTTIICENENIYVRIKLIVHGTNTCSISLTLAELFLIGINAFKENHVVYNGPRQISVKYNDVNSQPWITLALTKQKKNTTWNYWELQNSIVLTYSEFAMLMDQIPDIRGCASTKVLGEM